MHTICHDDVKISATRYNNKGNLIVTAHHTTTQAQLNMVADNLSQFVVKLSDKHGIPIIHPIKARANVKWSKILINSVPVGIRKERGPYTSDECHQELITHNPSYTSLKITQKPSLVHPPNSLKPDSYSSLVVAFKDPDGSARCSLLSNKQLYLLGARAKVSQWKEKPRNSPNPKANTKITLTDPSDPMPP